MSQLLTRTERHERAYRLRILGTTAASLLVVIAAFSFWPREETEPEVAYVATPQERITLELIEPTRQDQRAAPPPPPTLPPIEVPDDVEIVEEIIEFEELDSAPSVDPVLAELPPGPEEEEGPPAGPVFVESADVRPRIVGPVLPDYPREAERRDIRARVRVRLLIDERGRIQKLDITDRFLIDKKDAEERVAEIGYGVEQAALDAVRRMRFRPGRHGGQPVQTYTTITVSVGI